MILRGLARTLPEALRTERLAARIAELDMLAAAAAEPLDVRQPYFCRAARTTPRPACPRAATRSPASAATTWPRT